MNRFVASLVFLLTLSLGITAFADSASSEHYYTKPPQTVKKTVSTLPKVETKQIQQQTPSSTTKKEKIKVAVKEKKQVSKETEKSSHTKKEPVKTTSEETKSQQSTTDNVQKSDSNSTSIEQEVVRLVNLERTKRGLKPLQIDEKVSYVADKKSQDMKEKGYFSHQSPRYGSPFDMLKTFGVKFHSAGENIAAGYDSAQAVVDGWMKSEGHRQNILNPNFTHIGVGYVKGGSYGCYWTQLFISK